MLDTWRRCNGGFKNNSNFRGSHFFDLFKARKTEIQPKREQPLFPTSSQLIRGLVHHNVR